jgi:hypothetical protein
VVDQSPAQVDTYLDVDTHRLFVGKKAIELLEVLFKRVISSQDYATA